MNKLFITILNNTLVASWIILAVIILRFVFKRFVSKIPKWINCLLWGLVAIRLVFPFSIESIFSLIPSAKPVPVDIEYAKVPQIDSGITVVNTAINPILENNFAAEEIASANPIQIVIGVASYLWIFGVIALFIYAFVSFILIKRRVKNAQLVDKGIFRVETLDSPFILGIIRPSVYIPDSLDEEAYQCVIEHEKAHIKRGDFIWKPLGFLILSVYWFNPLCWIAYICLCKDIEYACDEKVTYDKDKEWKAKYCQTLLNCSSQRRLISACPVAFGEVSVKDRIKSVINYKKPKFWIICISIIVCIVVGICFLTSPRNNTYSVKVIMPAGFDYNQSDEEFSPLKSKITITLDEGHNNAQIILIPNEARTETAYEPVTLTAGVPVTMDVEKGAWFEIGVILDEAASVENQFIFSINGIETRIASHPTIETHPENQGEEMLSEEDKSELQSQTNPSYEVLTGDELWDYLDMLPNESEELAKEGCFVISNKGTCYGYNFFLDFWNSYNAGMKSAITIGQYTTEGDLILIYVAYDGEKVTLTRDTRRDKFAGKGERIYTDSSKYFYVMQLPGTNGNIMFLHNDSEMTPEKIEKILASSSMEGPDTSGFYWIGSYTTDDVVNYPIEKGNVPAEEVNEGLDILPEYVYSGNDPNVRAITEYLLADNYHYEMKAAVAIPAFFIFMEEVDENNADTAKVYGNYWVFVYEKNGTTLECISGGEAPGVMYVKRNGDEYVVDHFEQVRDGSYYAEDIKKICNGNKSLEDQYYNYSEFMTTTRIYNIKKYVEMFDLDIDSYHDYGWDPVMLSDYSFDGIEELDKLSN